MSSCQGPQETALEKTALWLSRRILLRGPGVDADGQSSPYGGWCWRMSALALTVRNSAGAPTRGPTGPL